MLFLCRGGILKAAERMMGNVRDAARILHASTKLPPTKVLFELHWLDWLNSVLLGGDGRAVSKGQRTECHYYVNLAGPRLGLCVCGILSYLTRSRYELWDSCLHFHDF